MLSNEQLQKIADGEPNQEYLFNVRPIFSTRLLARELLETREDIKLVESVCDADMERLTATITHLRELLQKVVFDAESLAVNLIPHGATYEYHVQTMAEVEKMYG